MSKTIKIVHLCNHTIRSKQVEKRKATITRSLDKDYDIVDNFHIIKSILNVTQYDNFFIVDLDCELFTHNKIKWIGSIKPEPATAYEVEYEVVNVATNEYNIYDCPRCNGNGWYVGIFDGNSNSFFASTGIEKMTQDYIKLLLTAKKDNLGTELTKITGREISSENITKNEIASAIREAESQYKKLQLDLASSGATLPDDEKLYKIEIRDIVYDDENIGFIAEIAIYNYNGESSAINLKV